MQKFGRPRRRSKTQSTNRSALSSEGRLAADNAALLRLHDLGAGLLSRQAVPELLQAAVDAAISLSEADKGTLQLYDPVTGVLRIAAQRGFRAPFLRFFDVVDKDSPGSCERAMHSDQRVLVEDVTQSPIFAGTTAAPVMKRAGVRAVQSTPLRATDGRLLGVCSTHWRRPHRTDDSTLRILDILCRQVADLIQVRQAEAALRQTEAALRVADRRKDEFISLLSHELRNPLTPILTSLEVLKLDGRDRNLPELAVIERQAHHMARLVDDLLDVTRITHRRIRLARRPVAVRDVVTAGVEMAAPLLEARRHELSVRGPRQDLWVDADAARLSQAVSNLVINAAKYTPPGGRIAVRTRHLGSDVVLEVQDNGDGIDAELLPHVFDMFIQARQESDRARGGLGVGLAIVRGLVELHGGTVRAASRGRGKGALFTVRLPAAAPPPALPVHLPIKVRRAGQPKRVLLVDDNQDLIQPLIVLLQRAGHQVQTAADGPAALKAMKRVRADVAVLDIGLPGMDGYALAARLKQHRGPSPLRLIAVTGYGQPADRARSKQAGFAEHITKPFKAHDLLNAIERVAKR